MPGARGLVLGALCLLGALGRPPAGRREVSMHFNPGWNDSSVNLLHVQAVDANSTLHYVWSSLGVPAVLLLYTENEHSTLHINWPQLLSPDPAGAIWVEPPSSVLHASAVVFTKLFEYDGANASGPARALFYPPYDLAAFSWDSVNRTLNHTALTAAFRGTGPPGTFHNGSIAFQVTAYEESSRDRRLPGLLHTANSSKLEFVMDGVAPRGNSSRFVLEMVMVEGPGRHRRLESARSIDDEYTPTIFEMVQLVSEPQGTHAGPGFLQWKTTAYGAREAKRENGIRCRYSPLQAVNGTLLGPSIAHAYFGKDVGGLAAINISFGGEDGEIYASTGYLSWSVLLGFGTPPEDAFSPLVVAIMAVALGTPVVLLVAGAIVVLFFQKKRYSEYEPIN
ncbi:glycosylated lysosomal membrane protein isoform X1 [Alligator sinensis]|uniref:Glycosylated lysosomal membrane protein isoform X1 n=2 Tax=Alligator sinensis TaxID=38654 RepID=A0A1U7SXN9_ALLSI|nr:glycosylated lysosomal membrane protein isoform X1 [Alligator sinensis]